jgi:putative endopeptidase
MERLLKIEIVPEIKEVHYTATFRILVNGSTIKIAKIGKPVDKTEWGMTPQTVNAYYNPVYNEIVFPAAILQPPFFNPKADAAVNWRNWGSYRS